MIPHIHQLNQIPLSAKIALFLILVFGVALRILCFPFHRTDKDDIGPAITVLSHYESFKKTNLNNPTHARYHSKLYQLLRKADSIGILKPIVQMVVVSWAWSYAPLQYVAMDLFINPDMSYREILFWGRLPSALCGCFNIFLMAFFLFRIYQQQIIHHSTVVLGTLLIAFSHEHLIFSQLMLNYAVGVTAHLILLIMTTYDKEVLTLKDKLLLFLIPFAQYQAFFLAISFAITVIYFKKTPFLSAKFFKNYWGLALPFISFGFLYILFLRNLHDLGLWPWKNGLMNEYVFDSSKALEFPQGFVYTVSFFLKKGYETCAAMLSCVNEDSPFYFLQNIFWGTTGVLGGFCLLKSRNLFLNKLWIYSIGVILIWIVMIWIQKFTLSPTRHNLIVLPVLIVWVILGVDFLQSLRVFRQFPIAYLLSIALGVAFLNSYPKFWHERKDKFEEKEFEKYIDLYRTKQVVCYGKTATGELLKNLTNFSGIKFTTTYDHYISYYDTAKKIQILKVPFPTESFLAYSQHLPLSLPENDSLNRMYFSAPLQTNNLQSVMFLKVPQLKDIFDSIPMNHHYRIVPIKQIYSITELEFSSKTKYGTNGYFLYFVEVNPRP
ncbi:MAG: hypothetical protein NZM38_02975 [Cytophagales bacterium]|nr:hypothetical protein [Cytophagales bacterium]MDW8383716.1 hypothetical protein [Flammeovirgaceae bacterium]